MGIYHMYTGTDKETHSEELDLENDPRQQSPQALRDMEIQIIEEPKFLDYHPAPNRRWLVILSGKMEIGLGDGSTHTFGPGAMRLIEDIDDTAAKEAWASIVAEHVRDTSDKAPHPQMHRTKTVAFALC